MADYVRARGALPAARPLGIGGFQAIPYYCPGRMVTRSSQGHSGPVPWFRHGSGRHRLGIRMATPRTGLLHFLPRTHSLVSSGHGEESAGQSAESDGLGQPPLSPSFICIALHYLPSVSPDSHQVLVRYYGVQTGAESMNAESESGPGPPHGVGGIPTRVQSTSLFWTQRSKRHDGEGAGP